MRLPVPYSQQQRLKMQNVLIYTLLLAAQTDAWVYLSENLAIAGYGN